MELVYLWVEEYKNIENQGFNFSPKFRCEFDGENLTITENKDYVSIFPKNINVTAIVGENGSGKSSIIEKIISNINIYDKEENTRLGNFIQCYYSKEINKLFVDYRYTLENKNIKIISNIDYEKVIDKNENDFLENSFYYHYKPDLDLPIEYNKYGVYTKNIIIFTEPNKQNNKINLEIEDEKTIKNMLNILNPAKNHLDTSGFFVPSRAEISFSLEQMLRESSYFEDNDVDKYEILRNQFRDTKNIQYVFLLHIIFYIEYIIRKYNPNNDFQKINTIGQLEDYSTKGIDDFIKKIDFIKLEEIVTFRRKEIRRDNHISIYENSLYLNEIEKTINLYKSINNIINLIKINNNQNLEYEINSEELNEKNIYFLTSLPRYIKIDFRDESGKHYSELSSGERTLLKLIYSIVNIINLRLQENLSNSITIFLDEIENTIHPNWQKKILNYLISLGMKYDIEFNIIIASHSPFILSDLPKDNVIFLKNGKQDTPDLKQTFGANIHTLLSNGFFMSDGLMGEFAKSKIRTIQITYKYISHRNKQKSLHKKEHKKSRRFIRAQLKTLWYIQSIIGEKFLQTIMKNYLQEIEEILFGNEKAIDNEIERLQNLRKSIKNAKN